MKINLTVVTLFVMFIVTACSTMSATDNNYYQSLANSPIYCSNEEDCEVKWGRAILWVSKNSHWKIRNQSDSLITTEGPFKTVYPAFIINKVPLGKGMYQIMFDAGCGNIFGCIPSTIQLKANFVEFVSQQTVGTSTVKLYNKAPIDQSEVKNITQKALIVKYDSIKIYEDPGFSSKPLANIEKGSTLTAVAENSNWYKVKVDEYIFGWVAKSWVDISE